MILALIIGTFFGFLFAIIGCLVWKMTYKTTILWCEPMAGGDQKIFYSKVGKEVKEKGVRAFYIKPAGLIKFIMTKSMVLMPADDKTKIYKKANRDFVFINYAGEMNYKYLSWPKYTENFEVIPQMVIQWHAHDKARRDEAYVKRDFWTRIAPYAMVMGAMVISAVIIIVAMKTTPEKLGQVATSVAKPAGGLIQTLGGGPPG